MALKKNQWMCRFCHRVNSTKYNSCYSCGCARVSDEEFKALQEAQGIMGKVFSGK